MNEKYIVKFIQALESNDQKAIYSTTKLYQKIHSMEKTNPYWDAQWDLLMAIYQKQLITLAEVMQLPKLKIFSLSLSENFKELDFELDHLKLNFDEQLLKLHQDHEHLLIMNILSAGLVLTLLFAIILTNPSSFLLSMMLISLCALLFYITQLCSNLDYISLYQEAELAYTHRFFQRNSLFNKNEIVKCLRIYAHHQVHYFDETFIPVPPFFPQ